jgi:AcrR family transcriptional regulator
MVNRTVKKPEERRQEFVETAEALFLQKGYQDTSVSDIVGKLGVAHGLFYYYFNSKEDILDSIVDNLVIESRRRLKIIVDSDQSPLEKFHQFIQQMFILKKGKPYLIGYILRERHRLFYHKWIQRALEEITPLLTEIVKQGDAEGCFSTNHPQEAVEFICNGMRFFLSSQVDLLGKGLQNKMLAAADLMERVLGARKGSIATLYQRMMPGVLDLMDKSVLFSQGGSHADTK